MRADVPVEKSNPMFNEDDAGADADQEAAQKAIEEAKELLATQKKEEEEEEAARKKAEEKESAAAAAAAETEAAAAAAAAATAEAEAEAEAAAAAAAEAEVAKKDDTFREGKQVVSKEEQEKRRAAAKARKERAEAQEKKKAEERLAAMSAADKAKAALHAAGKFYSPAGNADPLWKMQMDARSALKEDSVMSGTAAPPKAAAPSADPDARRAAALIKIASDSKARKTYKWSVKGHDGSGGIAESFRFDELHPLLKIEAVHWEQQIRAVHEDKKNRVGVIFAETTDNDIVVIKPTAYPASSQFFHAVASTLNLTSAAARIVAKGSEEGVALLNKLLSLDQTLRVKDVLGANAEHVKFYEISVFVPSVSLAGLAEAGKATELLGDAAGSDSEAFDITETAEARLREIGRAVALHVIVGSGLQSGIWEADAIWENELSIHMGHYAFANIIDKLVFVNGRAVPMDAGLRAEFLKLAPAQDDLLALTDEEFNGFGDDNTAAAAGGDDGDDAGADGAGGANAKDEIYDGFAAVASVFGETTKSQRKKTPGPAAVPVVVEEASFKTEGSEEYASKVASLVDRLLEQQNEQVVQDARTGAVTKFEEQEFKSTHVLTEFEALRTRINAISKHQLSDAALLLIQDGFLDVIEEGAHNKLTPKKVESWMSLLKAADLPDTHLIDIPSINIVLAIFQERFRHWQSRSGKVFRDGDNLDLVRKASKEHLAKFKAGPVSNIQMKRMVGPGGSAGN